MLRLLFVSILCLSALSIPLHAEPLWFAATGCGPYSAEEEPVLEGYLDRVSQDGKSEFLVHLGDVVSGSKKTWPESQYTAVATLLKKSKRPVLVVLGDNEWNDLDNPSEGLEFWDRNFRNFEQYFPDAPLLEKQSVRPENFAFVAKGVLVIGLNIVGGRVHDKEEWASRLQHDADWVKEQFQRHQSDTRSAVLLAQAMPRPDHELFFQQLTTYCQEWQKPVLYLHADGHVWQVEKAWRAPNLMRVQTDQVGRNPPVLVTVTDDPSEPFLFDRRLDIETPR